MPLTKAFQHLANWQMPFSRKKETPKLPQLRDWYNALAQKPFSTLTESDQAMTFSYEALKIPPVLETNDLIIYNGVRAPGETALHIEHITLYGGKTTFRMVGLYLIAAGLRIKYDDPVLLECNNKELSPCRGLKITLPKQSKLESTMGLAPAILTQFSWKPQLPADKPEEWVKELDDKNFPTDHLPWLRLGSNKEIYNEIHRPRSDEPIILHIHGTLTALCWLGRALLNFSLDDNPCHTLSLLNYGGYSSLAPGSAELRCVAPGGKNIPAQLVSWLAAQGSPATPSPAEPAPVAEPAAEPTPPPPATAAPAAESSPAVSDAGAAIPAATPAAPPPPETSPSAAAPAMSPPTAVQTASSASPT
ncbi:MAG: hypothetical protein V4525_14530 [Pseudomonadota bacterium]